MHKNLLQILKLTCVAILFFTMTASLSGKSPMALPSLHETYSKHFLVGTCYSHNKQYVSGKDNEIIKKHFNVFTPENAMKFSSTQRKEGRFSLGKVDEMLQFAFDNDIAVVGHTLVWNNQVPDWVFVGPDGEDVSRELALKRMRAHIEKVMGRYK